VEAGRGGHSVTKTAQAGGWRLAEVQQQCKVPDHLLTAELLTVMLHDLVGALHANLCSSQRAGGYALLFAAWCALHPVLLQAEVCRLATGVMHLSSQLQYNQAACVVG